MAFISIMYQYCLWISYQLHMTLVPDEDHGPHISNEDEQRPPPPVSRDYGPVICDKSQGIAVRAKQLEKGSM